MKPSPHRTAALRAAIGRALFALGACLALVCGSLAFAAPAAQQGGPFTVHLPLVRGGQGSAPTPGPGQPSPTPGPGDPTPTPDEPTPAPEQRGGLFIEQQVKNYSADVELDSAGGMHMAYAHFIPNAENPKAVYAFCTAGPSACASPTAWQSVALGERVREVQLELTAEGKPRLLIVSDDVARGGMEHHYAECNAGCASAASWASALVITSYNTSAINDQEQPQRSFAIDPQGRPAFVYTDRNYQYAEPDRYGAYYASCAANCTLAESWEADTLLTRTHSSQFSFDYEVMNYPVLTFTADGRPRFVARLYALNLDGTPAPDGLYYFTCEGQCEQAASWSRMYLLPTGGGSVPHPSWDLDLDSAGNPHVALFLGDTIKPEEFINQLIYVFCDTNCLDSSENWHYNLVLNAKGPGQGADIEVDSQGRPRMAWISNLGDLGYAWCNADCKGETAPWQQQIVETEEQLRAENPQAIPLHCRNDLWNGYAPTLALDGAGNPRIAYDVAVSADCYYDDTPGNPSDPPTQRFEAIWRGAHLTYFPQP
jgi:hypothetical protein